MHATHSYMKGDGNPSGGSKMRELSVVFSPSQPHCCMSEAKMAAPLSLAVFAMKLMVTFWMRRWGERESKGEEEERKRGDD